jgi:hypothetical protein
MCFVVAEGNLFETWSKMSMKRLLLCCTAILLFCALSVAQDTIEISLKNNSKSEAQTKERLQRLLQQYDLSKWIFTRKILIEDGVIPHSHPVLTLNTKEDGDVLLATFVHEQIHWFLSANFDRTEKAKAELKATYLKVPVGSPNGARNKESTYLHLIVNYLEYQAMRELVGDVRAKEVFEGKGYYRKLRSAIAAIPSKTWF